MTPSPRREDIEWLDIRVVDGSGTALPRLLLIGDSIVRSYRDDTARLLEGVFSVSRLSTSKSLGDPALFDETRLVLADYKWDVIHFNNGLHGFDYTEDEYGAALLEWVALLRESAPDARLIWANTTAIRSKANLTDLAEANKRVIERNAIANAIVVDRGIAVNDLYSICATNPDYYSEDGVHFNVEGVRSLAKQVAARVSE